MKQEIIELRKLLKYCTRLKKFVEYSMYSEHIDWEKSLTECQNNINFSTWENLKNNTDGTPIIFIGYIENNYNRCYILTRDVNPEKEFYDEHIVYDETTADNISSKITLKNCIGQCKHLNIIAIELVGLSEIKNKTRYHYNPYFYFEIQQEKRKEKAMELKLFKIMEQSLKQIPTVSELKNEYIYKNYIQQSIERYIKHPKFQKLFYPILNYKFEIMEFEIDFTRKRPYIENKLIFTYQNENKEEVTYRFGTIMPLFSRFQRNVYNLNTYDILLAAIYDNLLQLFSIFQMAVKNKENQRYINQITFNGFSTEIRHKFRLL